MGSIYYAVKCPCCGRSAFKDYYYKTDEEYIVCLRCGFFYKKVIESETANSVEYVEETNDGHGIFILYRKDGSREKVSLNSEITDEQLESYKSLFTNEEIDQEKSYLVSYKQGTFTILLGNPPENFYLPFEEYKRKMLAKYGLAEDEIMVPLVE
ncbi:hypothetical protein AB3U99_24025 [Niallia sp. JL1B1071]|uniref:hypothetical protein n=1 Tax=Niallia tiangongensis TaxID=3237105 RepID=UPI0037DC581B